MNTVILSGWDTFFLMTPFLAMLALGVFGLDERVASPRKKRALRRAFCELDPNGRPVLTDPDGRVFSGSRCAARPMSPNSTAEARPISRSASRPCIVHVLPICHIHNDL